MFPCLLWQGCLACSDICLFLFSLIYRTIIHTEIWFKSFFKKKKKENFINIYYVKSKKLASDYYVCDHTQLHRARMYRLQLSWSSQGRYTSFIIKTPSFSKIPLESVHKLVTLPQSILKCLLKDSKQHYVNNYLFSNCKFPHSKTFWRRIWFFSKGRSKG